jgi:hypothetical protein
LLDLFKQNLRNSKESPPVESKLTTICTQTELNGTKKNQDDSLPAAVDGYFINRMGHELVHLKRVGSDEKGVSDLLEYNSLIIHPSKAAKCRQAHRQSLHCRVSEPLDLDVLMVKNEVIHPYLPEP